MMKGRVRKLLQDAEKKLKFARHYSTDYEERCNIQEARSKVKELLGGEK